MNAVTRVGANSSLAVGCWLVLLVADALVGSGAVNLGVFASFAVVALARQTAAFRENTSLAAKPVVVRS